MKELLNYIGYATLFVVLFRHRDVFKIKADPNSMYNATAEVATSSEVTPPRLRVGGTARKKPRTAERILIKFNTEELHLNL